jgi:hypothetical protein
MSNASDRVCAKLEALEAEREASGSPRVVTGELTLYRKTKRYLRSSNNDVEAIENQGAELTETWEVACWNSGGRDMPADVREAIEQKIKEARAVVPVQKKNPGGRPLIHDWDAFWIEIIRIALIDELPDRPEMQRQMLAWWRERPRRPEESEIRKRLRQLYGTPGVLP